MARTSKFEHLKGAIIKEFEKGARPREVSLKFPIVPERNLYRWYDAWMAEGAGGLSNPAITLVDNVIPFNPEEQRQESDIKLARRTLRHVAGDCRVNPAIRVQASLGLMKLAYLRTELPKHIIEESIDADIEQISKELEERSLAQLSSDYRDLTQNGGHG